MKFNLLPIIWKEFIHIRRDPRSLGIVILMPIMQLLLFSYAINMDVKNIKLGILDESRTPASRDLLQRFIGSGYFVATVNLENRAQVESLFRAGTIKAVIAIPADYEQSIRQQASTPVQILIDGSDSNTGAIVLNASQQLLTTISQEQTGLLKAPFRLSPRIWYNPEQKSQHFIVPGLIAVLMMMICALLTSIAITREKETGTLEQILVAPVRPLELIVGKVIPYIALASLDATLVLLVGRFWFGVPFEGSILLMTFFLLLYVLTSLSLGILISTIAPNQQTSMMMAAMMTLMPSVLLSGFVFPVASMPVALQAISRIVPARYFLFIIRGILLKGNGFGVLWPEGLFLLLLTIILLTISVRRFKTRLA
jgi:ABC-2 type transport system permease protein